MMNNFRLVIVALLSLIFSTSCINKRTPKPIITVSVMPQKYFAEKIVGNKMEISCMIPAGSNPEAYDPSPSQLVNLNKSRAYLAVGNLGFELAWLDKLSKNHPDLRVVNTSDSIQLIHNADNDPDDHIHNTHSHIGPDPHTWSSPKSALIMAKNIYNAIIAVDPDNQKFYAKNYASLILEIKELDLEVSKKLYQLNNRSFLIYHPALTYLARDYMLNQFSVEFNGKEPTPRHLKTLIEIAKKEKIRVIFVQKEFDVKNAQILAEQAHCKIAVIDPLNYNWGKSIMDIVNALSNE